MSCRASIHAQKRSDRNRISQTAGSFDRGNAYSLITLSAVDLRGFSRSFQKHLQRRVAVGQQSVFAGGSRELGQSDSQNIFAFRIAAGELMAFQRGRKAMDGRARVTRFFHKLGKRSRAVFENP